MQSTHPTSEHIPHQEEGKGLCKQENAENTHHAASRSNKRCSLAQLLLLFRLHGLNRGALNGVDNICHCTSTTEVIHRAGETLQDWANGNGTSGLLYCL